MMSPDIGIGEARVPLGQALGAAGSDAFEDSATQQLIGIHELSSAKGRNEIAPSPTDPMGAPIPTYEEEPQQKPGSERIDMIDALDQVKKAGLDKTLKLPNEPDIAPAALAIMIDRARTRAEHAATIARGPQGLVPDALMLGTSFLVGAVDPLNIASAFVPVMGELRYGKLLASAGESAAARAGVRAGVGAAQGVTGQALLEPIDWYAHSQDGRDFGMSDVLHNLVFGGLLGAGLHAGGGALSDAWRAHKGRELYPYGPGEPLDRSAALAAAAPERGAAIAPDLDAVDRVLAGQSAAPLREVAPELAVLDDLPPRAQEDTARASIASLLDGTPVRSAELLDAAAQTDPRIAESFDLAKPVAPLTPWAARQAVADDIRQKLLDAGLPADQADANAALTAARYAARAERLGTGQSALELYRGENITVRTAEEPEHDPLIARQRAALDGGRVLNQRGREAEGQTTLPGTEPIGQGALAQRRADQPLKPGIAQKPLDVGLFGDEATQKSFFQSARDSTKTPEFKAWFGDSVAKDEKGDPLVVYHGSNRRFPEFANKPSFRQDEYGFKYEATSPAFFFADDGDTARVFAKDKVQIGKRLRGETGGRAQVRAFYLSVKNPLDFTIDDATHQAIRKEGRYFVAPHEPNPYAAEIIGDISGYDPPQTWREVQTALDDPEIVSRLKADGFDGARLAEENGAGSWAVFDPKQIKGIDNRGTFDASDPRLLYQGGEEPRGRITLADNRAVIDLYKSADASTFLHESGHLWLDELLRDAAHAEAPAALKADRDTVLNWLGVKHATEIGTAQHEKWAEGFEQYLKNGEAPSGALAKAFAQFKTWLTEIYRALAQSGQTISPEIKGVMDRLLATESEIADRADDLGATTRAVQKTARGRAAADPQTWSLYEYLASKGGLKPDPELAAIFGGRRGPMIGGFGPLLRKDGMALDEALRVAKEGHYLFDEADISGAAARLTPRDLLDSIDRESRGQKVYRNDHITQDREIGPEEEAKHIVAALHDELEAGGGQKGLEIDPRLEARVVEIVQKEGTRDVLAAYERAIMEDAERYEGLSDARRAHETTRLLPGWDAAEPIAAPLHGGADRGGGGPAGLSAGGGSPPDGGAPRAAGAGDRAPAASPLAPPALAAGLRPQAPPSAEAWHSLARAVPEYDAPDAVRASQAAAAAPEPVPVTATASERTKAALAADQKSAELYEARAAFLSPEERLAIDDALRTINLEEADRREIFSRGAVCLAEAAGVVA